MRKCLILRKRNDKTVLQFHHQTAYCLNNGQEILRTIVLKSKSFKLSAA